MATERISNEVDEISSLEHEGEFDEILAVEQREEDNGISQLNNNEEQGEEQRNRIENPENEQKQIEQKDIEEIEKLLNTNPWPSEVAPINQEEATCSENTQEFEKRQGTATLHGPLYEVRMILLIFLKLINLKYSFCLASNLDGVGDIDDIVVKYTNKYNKEKTLFIQLKHVEKDGAIKSVSFVRKDSLFDLHKYFISVCNSPVFKDDKHTVFSSDLRYLLITNAEIKHIKDTTEDTSFVSSISYENIKDISKDEGYDVFCNLLDEVNKVGRGKYDNNLLIEIRKKTRENDKLINVVKPLIDALQKMNTFENIKDDVFSHFISKTRILHKQKSKLDLDKVIKEEMAKALTTSSSEIDTEIGKKGEALEISSSDIDSAFESLIYKMLMWHGERYYLTEEWYEWKNIKKTQVIDKL